MKMLRVIFLFLGTMLIPGFFLLGLTLPTAKIGGATILLMIVAVVAVFRKEIGVIETFLFFAPVTALGIKAAFF
jgi:hypothetical protein